MAHPTLDPARKAAAVTLSAGNLTANTGTSGNAGSNGPFEGSNKYYCEFTVDSLTGDVRLGLVDATFDCTGATILGNDTHSYGYRSNAQFIYNSGVQDTLAVFTAGDVISMLYNGDASQVTFWKNGAVVGTTQSVVAGSWQPAIYLNNAQVTANFGATAYAYTPTAGYADWPASPTSDGAVTFLPLFALGNAPPGGAPSLQALTAAGTGMALVRAGAASLSALTAAGTGSYESSARVSLLALTAAGTGSAANNITADLVAPVPLLVAAGESGNVLTIIARAPVPLLVATGISPAIITAALSAPIPRLLATGIAGNVGTADLAAIVPTLVAAGYPAYTITASLVAPKPRLVAYGVIVATANYRTWVINARKNAPTEYTGWQFDSFAQFNGKVYAVSSAGLVELDTSTNDAGTAITGTVRTGANSFGTSHLKRVPRIYVGGQFKGDVTFRTITSEGGTREYLLPYNHLDSVQQRRVPIGKGPKSRYWQFELAFADDDVVDNILVYPTVLRRRVQ